MVVFNLDAANLKKTEEILGRIYAQIVESVNCLNWLTENCKLKTE